MSPVAQAVLASWSFPPYATALILLTALLYLRGWLTLRVAIPKRFTIFRLASFLGGLAALEAALASPIDAFDPFFLTDHMFQHMVLMMVVPPLILLGDPEIPLLHGLPRWASQRIVGPILSSRPVRWLGNGFSNPAVAWLLLSLAMLGWHVPVAYELALRSPAWHEVEHACFLLTALLFWWPVIQPWPSRARWPRWSMPIYLLLADFVNSALSAFLAFSDRVFYPSYLTVPRLWGISAQTDQAAAGVSMWVIGSFAFLIPAVWLTVELLSPSAPQPERPPRPEPSDVRVRRPVLAALTIALPLAALAYGWLAPDAIDIDDATVRFQANSGPFHVSVFGPRDPIEPGDCDISVLVQDAKSEEPILDADVDLSVQMANATAGAQIRATRRQSSNKLLESATTELPKSGAWQLQVSVHRGSEQAAVSSTLQVTEVGTAQAAARSVTSEDSRR
ncbi:MAG TPA: cytochrome c oxidase assembly protein [Candidatus Acidoferrales bacterium]|nr:cytochrome c oxidase assembly protein [Candidatus Acidoferrales bacterium]